MPMKRYVLTPDELRDLIEAARTPGVFLGGPLRGYDPAREASERAWQSLGERHGFDWRTVHPVAGMDDRYFEAEPLVVEKDATTADSGDQA